MRVYISSQQISSGMPEPTAFLRFDVVSLRYRSGQQPIAAKCESIKTLLKRFTTALNGAVFEGAKLEFNGRIDRNALSDFSDHSMLLAHVGNDLLSICNHCRLYTFRLNFSSELLFEQNAPSVISSILEMRPIKDCNNVKFVLIGNYQTSTALPVEAITKWFIPSADGRKGKKALVIRMENISNRAEIEARLKDSKYGYFLSFFTLNFINY